eukprot:SAG22_NODE_1335_length_4700_cov_2.556183_5_plen_86_part_00
MINGGRKEQSLGLRVYWSATPDPVNKIAVSCRSQYRPQFSSYGLEDTGTNDQQNDGSETTPGEAYDGFAIFGHGQMSVGLFVTPV